MVEIKIGHVIHSSCCGRRRNEPREVWSVVNWSPERSDAGFIYSGHFYSASSRPLLVRSALDTARILFRSVTPERHRQLCVKDLQTVPTWRLERDSNPTPSGRTASTLPMCHHGVRTVRRPRASTLGASKGPVFVKM